MRLLDADGCPLEPRARLVLLLSQKSRCSLLDLQLLDTFLQATLCTCLDGPRSRRAQDGTQCRVHSLAQSAVHTHQRHVRIGDRDNNSEMCLHARSTNPDLRTRTLHRITRARIQIHLAFVFRRVCRTIPSNTDTRGRIGFGTPVFAHSPVRAVSLFSPPSTLANSPPLGLTEDCAFALGPSQSHLCLNCHDRVCCSFRNRPVSSCLGMYLLGFATAPLSTRAPSFFGCCTCS